MIIWILAILIFGGLAVLGRFQGSVRFLVSLIGLFLAVLLAFPLVPLSKPLVGLLGVKTTFWAWSLPPLINFLVIYGIGIGISFFVHRKVDLFFKYRADDLTRLRFERLNERLGIALGLVMGCIWLLIIGYFINVAGYPAVQLASDNTTGMFKILGAARRDLQSSGLDKTLARFDRTPSRYYEASDILGLIYNNPILISRLAQYPPFLLTGERPEYQEIANDKDYMSLLLSKSDITQIIQNPKTQTVINNAELLTELNQQDFKDLQTFLETGKSPKFDDEKILGRWHIDIYATKVQERKKKPDMTTAEMRQLNKISELMSSISFVATTDKKAVLKVDLTEAQKQLLQAGQAPASAVVDAAAHSLPAGMSPELASRYGLNRRPAAPPRPAAPVAVAPRPNNAVTQPIFSAQGSWKNDEGKYQISMQDEKGKQETVEALVEGERLTIASPVATLIFAKVQ